MINRYRRVLVALAIPVWGHSLALKEEALADLLEKGNSRVIAAKQEWQAAQRLQNHLQRSFLPEISATGGAETFKTGVQSQREEPYGSVGAELNLYRGGRDVLEERARDAKVRQEEAAFRHIFLSELHRARRLFWEAVFSRELLIVLDEKIKRNDEFLTTAKRRIQSGMATETDRFEFEMHRTQLEQDRARIRLSGVRAERLLKAQVGMGENTPLELPDRIPHIHDEHVLDATWDGQDHPEIQQAVADSQTAESVARQSQRRWAPSVDLYGDYSLYTFREREFYARGDRDESVAGARVSLPLFQGFRAEAAAQALRLEASAKKNVAQQVARDRRADFVTAQEELSLLHDLLHSAEEAVEQGKKYLLGTRSEYARGVKNSPDVLGALQKTLELERRAADIRRDYQFTKADLLYLLGK